MRQQWKFSIIAMMLMVFLILMGCATETPWRKATVTTYELVGVGLGATKDTGESLNAQGLIPAEQLVKIKAAYNKAREVYIKAGETLKLASATKNAADQGKLLDEYGVLLADFKNLALEVYNLIKNFRNITYFKTLSLIEAGGETWRL